MSSYLSSRAKTDYPLCAPRRDAESLLRWDRGSSGTAPRHKPSNYSTSDGVLPIGEFRQPRSGPLMLLFANSLDGVRGGLVSGIQPAMGGLEGISRVGRTLGTPDAHPNLKEEPCRDSRPQLSGGAQLRSCSDTPVRYFKNTSMGRRASPPVHVRALACLQIPLTPSRTT